MNKTNKQIERDIAKQLEEGTFVIYRLENNNFFSECHEFLENNKLILIPVFTDLSYDLAIVKENYEFVINEEPKIYEKYTFEKEIKEKEKRHLKLVR